MFQAHPPDSLEDARPYPGLETQVTSAAGTVLARDHLPLAAGSENVENTVEHGTVQNPRPTIGPRRFVRWQDGLDQFPQVIRNLAESIPLLRFLAHRIVLHNVTMLVSALANEKREGF